MNEVGMRTASPTTAGNDELTTNADHSRTLMRQQFALKETVSLVFVLFKLKVKIVGTIRFNLHPRRPLLEVTHLQKRYMRGNCVHLRN